MLLFFYLDTLERPFGCTLCGTCFTRKDLLVRHRRTCKGVPSRRRRKSVLSVISKDEIDPALASLTVVSSEKTKLKEDSSSINLIHHSRSASLDSALQQRLPDISVNFNSASSNGSNQSSSGLNQIENRFHSSLIDPLLSTYSKQTDLDDSVQNEANQQNNSSSKSSADHDEENDSDLQSSVFDQDEDFQSPRSTHSSMSSQSSHKSISNNFSQYPFGLDSGFDCEALDYEKVCHLSPDLVNGGKNIGNDRQPQDNSFDGQKSNSFSKSAFEQANLDVNSMVNALNNSNYWSMNTQSNDQIFDGISMLNPTLTTCLNSDWNSPLSGPNIGNIHANRLFNKKIQSLFGNTNNNVQKSDLHELPKSQNSSLEAVSGFNKAVTNSLSETNSSANTQATKLNDPFSLHLSQYSSIVSGNKENYSSGFDYSQILPNSKSTNAILDFFAGAKGSYNGSGNDIFDPEILKASS